MKTFLLIRFNKNASEDVILLNSISEFIYNNKIHCIDTPSTMLLLFKSEFRHKDIYIALGKIKPVVAFFLIDVTENDFCINMPEELTKQLMEFLGKNYVNKAEYSDDLDLKDLEKSLQDAIDEQKYELAAEIRDKIKIKKENKV